jgi:hypothetical protein
MGAGAPVLSGHSDMASAMMLSGPSMLDQEIEFLNSCFHQLP